MPLLMSPIDGQPMKQVNRFGIELDVCTASGGVWLDKGELEKLLAIMREEVERESAAPEGLHPQQYPGKNAPQQRFKHDDDDDDDDDRYRQKHHHAQGMHHGQHRPKSKMSRIMDVFDF